LTLLALLRLTSIIYAWNATVPRVFLLIGSSFTDLGATEGVASGFNYFFCWLLSILIIIATLMLFAGHLYMPIKYLKKEEQIKGNNRIIFYILGVLLICPGMYLMKILVTIP
jgi:hypothetical protein